jgi:hypothetical protein
MEHKRVWPARIQLGAEEECTLREWSRKGIGER